MIILGVRYQRTLSHVLHCGNLGFGKVIQKTGFLVIRICIYITGPWRVATQPLHFACYCRRIKPRTHIAVFPIVGAVCVTIIVAAVRLRTVVVVGLSIIRKRIDYVVGKHKRAFIVHAYAPPYYIFAIVLAKSYILP